MLDLAIDGAASTFGELNHRTQLQLRKLFSRSCGNDASMRAGLRFASRRTLANACNCDNATCERR